VGVEGLLEIKCPYSLHLKEETPQNWPSISKTSSLGKDSNGNLFLKRNHAHYFQIVMQLHITGREWCDYFIWSKYGFYLERICRSTETETLWNNMEIKLEKFWMEDLAPELVDSRFDRGYTEYRCPQMRVAERQKKAQKKKISKVVVV